MVEALPSKYSDDLFSNYSDTSHNGIKDDNLYMSQESESDILDTYVFLVVTLGILLSGVLVYSIILKLLRRKKSLSYSKMYNRIRVRPSTVN